MDLEDRIGAIATAAKHFPWLGDLRAPTISCWIELELGQALNSAQPQAYGKEKYLISPLSPILHIVSGNTPHAAIQSLIRGILIGARNWVKLPEEGLPEVEAFVGALSEDLRPDLASKLRPHWMEQAEAVVVFGSDETIREISRQILPSQRFVVHGHKVSLGLVSTECSSELAGRIVRDVFAFDQLGCLSPQLLYVTGDSIRFARELAQHFEQNHSARIHPRHAIATTLRAFREEWKFRAATEPGTYFWESREALGWAVVHDPSPGLAPNPLYGTIFIKPMPSDLPSALLPMRRHIATVGLDPIDTESLKQAVGIGAQRVCAIGQMQSPPVTWHHDGQATLASLIRYVDIEGLVI